MGIIVQKFGGSSVATTEKLKKVCSHITKEFEKGNDVAVIVSAQGKTTDRLITEEKEITKSPNKREHDVLVSTGEQITISKLAIMLNNLGYKAISLTGWQIPIVTDNNFGNARIKSINSQKIIDLFDKGYIVIIAGFQGINENGEITTLGRGGSDTTAVAIASSLKADKCDIYTDVDGVFTTDPRITENAKKIDNISYDEMLELSSMGAKVLHNRCVEIGKKYNIPIAVKDTGLEESLGTIVRNSENLENVEISGIAKDDNISRITVMGLENKIGKTYKVFKLLAEHKINVDMIVQSFGESINKNISFTIKTTDLAETMQILEKNLEYLTAKEIIHYENLSKVSIVGIGMTDRTGIASKMFEALYEKNINMHLISTSEIKVTVLVNQDEADEAVKSIHDKFFKE